MTPSCPVNNTVFPHLAAYTEHYSGFILKYKFSDFTQLLYMLSFTKNLKNRSQCCQIIICSLPL
jgi:hypothetical protein